MKEKGRKEGRGEREREGERGREREGEGEREESFGCERQQRGNYPSLVHCPFH